MSELHLSPSELHNLLLPQRRWWCAHADRLGIERSHWVRIHWLDLYEPWTLCWTLCPEHDLIQIEGPNGDVVWSQRVLIKASWLWRLTEEQRIKAMSFLRRKVEEVKAVGPVKMESCPIMRTRPALIEWLSCETWPDDGKARMTSTLTISIVDGSFKLSLNDREGQRSTFVTAATLGAALQALEDKVEADDCDWRAWTDGYKGKGKKGR